MNWNELVAISLLPIEQRTMRLSALRREDIRTDLTDKVIYLALRRVGGD